MKKIGQLLFAVAALSATSLQAQFLLDSFSNDSNLASPIRLAGTTSGLASTGASLNYTVISADESDFVTRRFTGAVGSVTSDWSVRVDITYDANVANYFDSGNKQAINVGLMVTKSGESIVRGGGLNNPLFNAFLVSSNLYHSTSDVISSDIRTGAFNAAGTEPTDGKRYAQVGSVSGTWSSTVMISYTAASQMLTASYDNNGSVGGHTMTLMYDGGDALADELSTIAWNASSFDVYVVGNSNYDDQGPLNKGPSLNTNGLVTMESLVGTGAIAAIPEPSTYAAIAGLGVLGLVAWRRRSRGAVAA